MSNYITLGEAEQYIMPLIDTDDFINTVNRAVRRLYDRAATAGQVIEWTVLEPLSFTSSTTPGSLGELSGFNFVPIPEDYSSALYFLLGDDRRYVIPLESKYADGGYDTTAFVDRGIDNGNRMYELPIGYVDSDGLSAFKQLCDDGYVKAILRKSYTSVVNTDDKFPFMSLDAIKMAVLSSIYMDENDLERSNEYLKMALSELEDESLRFRGPQRMSVSFVDEAALESAESLM